MPELPEVETTMRGILPNVLQQKVEQVVVRQYQLRWPIIADLHQQLSGQVITRVIRRAKYILLMTKKGTLIIHLGMSGHLRVLQRGIPAKKHDHVDIIFKPGHMLRFHDPRRFGAMVWTSNDPNEHILLKKLGVEPLTDDFSADYLWERAQGKKIAIKSFLMDNHVVTGVGNIYAAESLFKAGILPTLPASSITKKRFSKLVRVVKSILQQAITRGGTTLKDFIDSEGKPGYFSQQLKVYGREGLPCIKCDTELQLTRLGGRSTVYCPACQS